MAEEYIKVLNDLNEDYSVVGRSKEGAENFEKSTGVKVIPGGLEQFLKNSKALCSHAIVAVNVESLYATTKLLLNHGVKHVLLEKPGALAYSEFEDLASIIQKNKANVVLAYNRRFYASVIKAKEIIQQDGGVTSFNFEFTEWVHVIAQSKSLKLKQKLFLANSTHVADLAFYLGGYPKEITTYRSGSLEWHPSGSVFSGAGVSESSALFSYKANWESAGRWLVECLTSKRRLVLCPLEELSMQKKGSIALEKVAIDNKCDLKFKPGLYQQVCAFLNNDLTSFISLSQQAKRYRLYSEISGE